MQLGQFVFRDSYTMREKVSHSISEPGNATGGSSRNSFQLARDPTDIGGNTYRVSKSRRRALVME